ncbi:Group II intron-encoded protein LtrA [Flavobacterium anhuiense]|uniref:Group II intron-encoded protein LtrA n=1 Tax=Flavobacterium anhuiense TaxID=459526 RepID=A0AAC9GGM9_9FLAO|nr:RNA-directed DNA polymerase [Flavobacterium anhuiense]AOC93645.1 Group II intron-encoded protein LtrA [Flavobacterium anhuiense]URM38864.1 RNA-directed DNA polymerase [Flavobacterium anhuiense]
MTQYEQFLTPENFKLAFIRLKTASRNLYKTIYYEDLRTFGLYLDENIDSTIVQIKNEIYKPEKSHKIFIPKKDNLVRPLSILTFIDLLIYQAITNVIADSSNDIIAPYYDNLIFGNIINLSTSNATDREFFFKSWKKKWKRFNEVSKENFEDGYKYLSEFDIASFFDTIDHNILCEILANTFKIDIDILNLLSKCLESWTADSNHRSFKSKHGIPQGPISSHFLADLYLFYIDTEIKKLNKKYDFKYLRYVDDIRIFSKEKLVSQKIIASLDLISRDLGLIPQGSKILIKEIIDIEKELKIQNSKFSEITKEYKKENEGKPAGVLKSKTHKNLKKRFINCFDKSSDEVYLDKTVIGFSLYKLNKDDEIKKMILKNSNILLTHFEGILYYFKKHFAKDSEVLDFLKLMLNDEDILFHHLIALIFKNFPELPFDEKIYQRYNLEKHRHWLVNFYMISWLYHNDKKELILTDANTDNYFIQRELNNYKYFSSSDTTYRKIFSSKLLENSNPLLALQGLNLLFHDPILFKGFKTTSEQNSFIKFLLTRQPLDIIIHTLKYEWNINEPDTFFNRGIWTDDLEYEELKISFLLFLKSYKIDPSKALLNLNGFNNLVFNKFCDKLSISKPSNEYGVNLNSDIIEKELPHCNMYWKQINEKRNQKTEAHPFDKYGNIRLRITNKEFEDLYQKQIITIDELCNFRKY